MQPLKAACNFAGWGSGQQHAPELRQVDDGGRLQRRRHLPCRPGPAAAVVHQAPHQRQQQCQLQQAGSRCKALAGSSAPETRRPGSGSRGSGGARQHAPGGGPWRPPLPPAADTGCVNAQGSQVAALGGELPSVPLPALPQRCRPGMKLVSTTPDRQSLAWPPGAPVSGHQCTERGTGASRALCTAPITRCPLQRW